MVLFLPLFWWLISRVFEEGEPVKRIIGVITSIGIFAGIMWAIWVPASIRVGFDDEPVDHPPGSEIYGIKWREDYSQLTMMLYNYGVTDMRDVDLRIATDLLIAGAGIGPGINACSAEAAAAGKITFGKIATMYTDRSGKTIEIPWTDQNRRLASSLFRIKCERVASKSKIEIKFPILAKDWARGEPKKQVRWAVVWMSYMAGYRPVQATVPKCFVSECSDMPLEVSDVPLAIGPSDWSYAH